MFWHFCCCVGGVLNDVNTKWMYERLLNCMNDSITNKDEEEANLQLYGKLNIKLLGLSVFNANGGVRKFR